MSEYGERDLIAKKKFGGGYRVLPRKNPQSGTRFDMVCHIAELEGIMLEGIYGNYYTTEEISLFYAELGSKGQKKYIH